MSFDQILAAGLIFAGLISAAQILITELRKARRGRGLK